MIAYINALTLLCFWQWLELQKAHAVVTKARAVTDDAIKLIKILEEANARRSDAGAADAQPGGD
ncbi:MAG: hypothetical protein IPK75_18950 [Acidobacteria bacterium]|nr:hypothetical protein [Acidobacteriota bacterium]